MSSLQPEQEPAIRALTDLYHAWLTGLVLAVSLHEGPERAGELMFRVYRRHHENQFLASFAKLGLSDLPHAVACARYHYLSNAIGGVAVEYMEESERKAWVRFAYPRWVYEGTALCGMPLSVSRGMLEGWYAQNGVSLKNPNLAFVCTSEDMGDGYGLAGYFIEREHAVADDERLIFAFDEHPPPYDPLAAPSLDADVWTERRLVRARLNYSIKPLVLALLALNDLCGESRASEIASRAARIVGLQTYAGIARSLELTQKGAGGYALVHAALCAAHGEQCTIRHDCEGLGIEQRGWLFARGVDAVPATLAQTWANLWQGLAISHDRDIRLALVSEPVAVDSKFSWRVLAANS